ncbi:MAG: 3-hydroxyacyl-ACP dehydratase FabZ [Lentisphaerae bacterium]|nr:3-hydroxyacyl-ACP dehydratase FabZ [Lentisphaerota bacterium]
MPDLKIEEILGVMPHRYPFILVDRIIECDDRERIVGIKNVTINEPFFQGHFPGVPVMPGVLQLEAMAQTGGILLARMASAAGQVPYLMAMDKVKFRRVVRPGDQLRIEAKILNIRSRTAKFEARATVEGAVASQAEMMCMLTEQKAGA